MHSDRIIEAASASLGILGAFMLAGRGDFAGWGWIAFLVSNAGWIVFAIARRHWWLLAQQIGFTATSAYGAWNWLLRAPG